MPHMSLQSLNVFGLGVEVFSIILLPRGLHSPKSGTVYCHLRCSLDGNLVKSFDLYSAAPRQTHPPIDAFLESIK